MDGEIDLLQGKFGDDWFQIMGDAKNLIADNELENAYRLFPGASSTEYTEILVVDRQEAADYFNTLLAEDKTGLVLIHSHKGLDRPGVKLELRPAQLDLLKLFITGKTPQLNFKLSEYGELVKATIVDLQAQAARQGVNLTFDWTEEPNIDLIHINHPVCHPRDPEINIESRSRKLGQLGQSIEREILTVLYTLKSKDPDMGAMKALVSSISRQGVLWGSNPTPRLIVGETYYDLCATGNATNLKKLQELIGLFSALGNLGRNKIELGYYNLVREKSLKADPETLQHLLTTFNRLLYKSSDDHFDQPSDFLKTILQKADRVIAYYNLTGSLSQIEDLDPTDALPFTYTEASEEAEVLRNLYLKSLNLPLLLSCIAKLPIFEQVACLYHCGYEIPSTIFDQTNPDSSPITSQQLVEYFKQAVTKIEEMANYPTREFAGMEVLQKLLNQQRIKREALLELKDPQKYVRSPNGVLVPLPLKRSYSPVEYIAYQYEGDLDSLDKSMSLEALTDWFINNFTAKNIADQDIDILSIGEKMLLRNVIRSNPRYRLADIAEQNGLQPEELHIAFLIIKKRIEASWQNRGKI